MAMLPGGPWLWMAARRQSGFKLMQAKDNGNRRGKPSPFSSAAACEANRGEINACNPMFYDYATRP
jgi:hypothetical protein